MKKIGLVVSDIVSWIFIAALKAEIRSCLITNFTWTEIYREYLSEEITRKYKNAYKLANNVLLYDFATRYYHSLFSNAEKLSLPARKFNLNNTKNKKTI